MKRLIPILLLGAVPLFAETVIVKEPTLLKGERAAVSLKAGTEVELLSRDADTATVKYRNVTGKIPAAKLEGGAKGAAAPKAEEKKAEEKKPLPAEATQPATAPRPPQTNYGKAVQKAKDNAAAHDKKLVKPSDEVLKE